SWVQPKAKGSSSQSADIWLTDSVQMPSASMGRRLPRYWSPAPNRKPATHVTTKITQGRYRTELIEQGSTPSHRARGMMTVRASDRKSTRLNSSHVAISYAVFCLKKK